MREPGKLRDRAAQLRALAVKAREDGKPLLADEITKLVIALSERADTMDQSEAQSEASSRRLWKRVRAAHTFASRP